MHTPGTWHAAGQKWLESVNHQEWLAQGKPIPRKGRGRRYNPPDWIRDAIDALNRGDEETFKAIKMSRMFARPGSL